MPRRTDGSQGLRPPLEPSRASGPSRPSSRNRLYTLGASSSTSLVAAVPGASPSAAAGSAGVAPPLEAGEGPYLTSAETHFGRMTLTAPDNMRRKKDEAREKRAKAKRKKAEAADVASNALLNVGGSSLLLSSQGQSTSAGRSSREEVRTAQRPHTPANEQPVRPSSGPRLEVVASSPAATSQPASSSARRRRDPTAPRRTAAATAASSRAPSRASNASDSSLGPSARATEARDGAIAPESTAAAFAAADAAAAAEIASIALSRRTDVYSASYLGDLPGADDALEEADLPPPFPVGATRPHSPPAPPGEPEGPDGTWSERQQEEQREAERWRVPDSPPPAFKSDESSAESEAEQGAAPRELSAWERDAAEGLSLEERLEREALRRGSRAVAGSREQHRAASEVEVEVEAEAEAEMQGEEGASASESHSLLLQQPQQRSPSPTPQYFADAISGAEEDAEVESQHSRQEAVPVDVLPTPAAAASSPPQPIEVRSPSPPAEVAEAAVEEEAAVSASEAPNLGAIVMEARRRRMQEAQADGTEAASRPSTPQSAPPAVASSAAPTLALGAAERERARLARAEAAARRVTAEQATLQSTPSSATPPAAASEVAAPRRPATVVASPAVRVPAAPASAPSPARVAPANVASPSAVAPARETARLRAAASASSHRRVVSDSRVAPRSSATSAQPRAIVAQEAAVKHAAEAQAHRGRATRVRPRPASESHTRFRDDAAAAAQRRSAAWKGMPSSQLVLPTAPRPLSANDTAPGASAPFLTTSGVATASLIGRGSVTREANSDDSDEDWEADRAALAALQRAREAPAVVLSESSDEEEDDKTRVPPGGFARLRSDSIDLGRRGVAVPRAPPPLVLGRSRGGGAAYSSSSESSSDDAARESSGSEEEDELVGKTEAAATEETLASLRMRAALIGLDSGDVSVSQATPYAKPSDLSRSSSMASSSSRARFAADPLQDDAIAASVERSFPAPHRVDKGKAPVRPAQWLPLDTAPLQPARSSPTPPAPPLAAPRAVVPAGHFEEDEGSSGSFSDSEDDADATLRAEAEAERMSSERRAPPLPPRPPVSNRLKGLFNTPAGWESHLTDTPTGWQKMADDRSGRPSGSSSGHDETVTRPTPQRVPSNGSQRAPSDSYKSPAAGMSETDARAEVLAQVAKLQSTGQHRQDSLSALEALLTRGARPAEAGADQPLAASARLSRSGAVTGRNPSARMSMDIGGRPASFVNPRSSVAPRPLGRLPTITAATRHFPPSQQPSVPAVPPQTTGLLANIPQEERRTLPQPLEPSRANDYTASNDRPPLPPRQPGNRVSAIISRFEPGASAPLAEPRPLPGVPAPRAAYSSQQPPAPLADQQPGAMMNDDSALRRRPPPPPPPRAQSNRSSLLAAPAPRQSLQPTPDRSASVSPAAPPLQPSPRTQALDTLTSHGPPAPPRSPFMMPSDAERVNLSLAAGDAASNARRRNGSRELQVTGLFDPATSEAAVSTLPRPPSVSGTPQPTAVPAALQELRAQLARPGSVRGSRPLPTPPSVRPTLQSSASTASVNSASRAAREDAASGAAATSASNPFASPAVQSPLSEHPPRSSEVDVSPASPLSNDNGEAESGPSSEQANAHPRRAASYGITDLDLLASQLEREGHHYDEITAIAEFLGPAKETRATPEEMANLAVGRVEVEHRRVTREGKVKQKLAVAGVRVEKCMICLAQFRAAQSACIFPCLHIFHEQCATQLLRNARSCPTCRQPIA